MEQPATLTLSRDGLPDWHPTFLLEASKAEGKTPAMEATEENFRHLFDFVTYDLRSGEPRRESNQALRASDLPRPRGPVGNREYFVASAGH